MLFSLLVFSLAALSAAQDHVKRDHEQMRHLHQDSKGYIAMLESSERDSYQKPDQVLEALKLRPEEIVADIGAGSGYFSFRMAQRLAAQGRVYAVDINPAMIRHMNKKIRDFEISNLVTILAEPDDPLLFVKVDRFLICNTWHHIEDQEQYLSNMKTIIKPGGQVVIIDFKKEELPFGPPLEEKIARGDLVQQMQRAGFRIREEHDFLPHQYFLVFELE